VVIAINDSYQLAPWADYHYFCDKKWHDWHKDRADYQAYTGQRITQDDVIEPGIWKVAGKAGKGLSDSPDLIHYGQNSGYQALNIAWLMGARRILLLGYDMKFAANGASHWFGDHPDKIRSNYPSWLTGFSQAAEQLHAAGVEVINCSPDTALICFNRASLASVLSSAQAPA
jgi:hypothetical protein